MRVSAKPGKADELKRLFIALATPTRKEAGCLAWEVFQNLADPCDFTFVEEWSSAAALDAHWSSPHVQDALARGLPLLAASPDERRYAKIA